MDRCVDAMTAARSLGGDLASVRHVAAGITQIRAMTDSARRELAPSAAASCFDAPLGRHRAVAWRSLPLRDVHDAAKRIGPQVTLNDAVVALIVSGVATWTRRQPRPMTSLRVRIPVSLHDSARPDEANRDSFIDVDVPLDGLDVVGRLHVINAQTAARKQAHDAQLVDRLLHGVADLPWGSHLIALADGPREFALCISNVVGPRGPVSVGSCRVNEFHSVVEVAESHDLRASVISCDGGLSISLCADADRVEPGELMQGIDQAWGELRNSAGRRAHK